MIAAVTSPTSNTSSIRMSQQSQSVCSHVLLLLTYVIDSVVDLVHIGLDF